MSAVIRCVCVSMGVSLALLSAPVWADTVIYDNGAPDYGNAGMADFDQYNVYEAIYQNADDFVLAEGANVLTDVHWWGVYWPDEESVVDDFTILIFDAGEEGPGDLAAEIDAAAATRTDTGEEVYGLTLYAYDFDLDSGFSLSPSTTYYLSIMNNTVNSYEAWFWAYSNSYDGDSWYRRLDQEGFWTAEAREYAFQLTGEGVVPEPATISLLGIGLLTGAVARLRRRPAK